MFPSEVVLERRVRTDADEDLAATNLPLFILKCKDRKAEGYAAAKLEIYNQRLEDMVIGVRLADEPPAVSYLAIRGSASFADIVAVDKTVIVIRLDIPGETGLSYLIYDAVALSLRMIPAPEDHSWAYVLSSRVSVARPCSGTDYALVHTGRVVDGGEDSLFLWRPSSSSPPWSKKRKCSFPGLIDWSVNQSNMEFSFNGHTYWADLLCGVFYCSCNTLFDDNSSVVKFGGFIRLPVKPVRHNRRTARLASYRTMGVVRDSIRFVSIDGFQDYVELKDRTVTVWKLLGHDQHWEEEHKLSLETLWGFEGFGDLPKDLTPMYPLLSMEDTDIVYLVLGECGGNPLKRRFFPSTPRFLLAVDMTNKIVRSSVPLEDEDHWFSSLVSCGFSLHLQKALDGPCDDEGIPTKKKHPIPLKKPRMKKLVRGGRNVAESPIPMKKRGKCHGGNVAESPIPMKKRGKCHGGNVAEASIHMKKRKCHGGNVAEATIHMKNKRMCC
ncbi:hypothetical protein ACQ4PT_014289 [Festuca glaucescens]